jgi:large subunit ribosomal protein L21
VYAIVKAGGRQEKVGVGDEIEVNHIKGDLGSAVTLPAVLVVDDEAVTSKSADLAKVAVSAEVVEHFRGPKIRIMHYKNKTGYKRRLGHRQDLTRLRVTGIETGS